MILLWAFFPIFLILFIALPIIGANLGKKNKLGAFIGALIGVIISTVMLMTLSRGAYDLIFFIVFVINGWIVGDLYETDKGVKSGKIKGTAMSIIIAIVLYFLFDNYSILFVWLGLIIFGIVLGKRINIGDQVKSGAGLGVTIGIVFDIVILCFLFLGFSAQ